MRYEAFISSVEKMIRGVAFYTNAGCEGGWNHNLAFFDNHYVVVERGGGGGARHLKNFFYSPTVKFGGIFFSCDPLGLILLAWGVEINSPWHYLLGGVKLSLARVPPTPPPPRQILYFMNFFNK